MCHHEGSRHPHPLLQGRAAAQPQLGLRCFVQDKLALEFVACEELLLRQAGATRVAVLDCSLLDAFALGDLHRHVLDGLGVDSGHQQQFKSSIAPNLQHRMMESCRS